MPRVEVSECCDALKKTKKDVCSKCKKPAKFYIDFWKDKYIKK